MEGHFTGPFQGAVGELYQHQLSEHRRTLCFKFSPFLVKKSEAFIEVVFIWSYDFCCSTSFSFLSNC